MGTFYTECAAVEVPKVLVDTGSELSWIAEGTFLYIARLVAAGPLPAAALA